MNEEICLSCEAELPHECTRWRGARKLPRMRSRLREEVDAEEVLNGTVLAYMGAAALLGIVVWAEWST